MRVTGTLVDAHAHLELASPAPPGAWPRQAAVASAQAQLAAGVLALREPGGPARASTGIGSADGLPRTFTAGRANFSAQVLAEATRRVHAVGARIAVHVVGLQEVVEAAIEAGVDSIERRLSGSAWMFVPVWQRCGGRPCWPVARSWVAAGQ